MAVADHSCSDLEKGEKDEDEERIGPRAQGS